MKEPIIWIVDDDPIYIFLAKKVISGVTDGYLPQVYENGKAALNTLFNIGTNERPDIILLDINMPIMDGWEFLDNCSNSPAIADGVNIYMVSSSNNSIDAKHASEYDIIKGFISKPLKKDDVLKICEGLVFDRLV
jgi:CheY-like chemotaxis protein